VTECLKYSTTTKTGEEMIVYLSYAMRLAVAILTIAMRGCSAISY
jgi:hypothetical protein